MSRRRSLLNKELYSIWENQFNLYEFVFSINDLGELQAGGKDNDILIQNGTVLEVPMLDGVFMKLGDTALLDYGAREGFGLSLLHNGSRLNLLNDGSFFFDVSDKFEGIRQNSSIVTSHKYTMEHFATGRISTGTISFRVFGTNKAPILITQLPATVHRSLDSYHLDLFDYIKDPNETETDSLRYSLSGDLPPGLVLNGTVISGTLDRLAHEETGTSGPGVWDISVTAEDIFGETVTGILGITVNRAAITAKVKNITTDFREPVSIDASNLQGLLSGITSNGVLDTVGLKVVEVEGQPLSGTSTLIDMGSKGTVKASPDGSYIYDPNGQFDDKPSTQTVSFTYKVANDAGAESVSNVEAKVVITSVNPSITEPSMGTFSVQYRNGTNDVKVGDTVELRATVTFNKGKSVLQGTSTPRTGPVSSFVFTGEAVPGSRQVSDTENTTSVSTTVDFTAVASPGNKVYTATAVHGAGLPVLNSVGQPFKDGIPAGTFEPVKSFTLVGIDKYEWFMTETVNSVAPVPMPYVGFSSMKTEGTYKFIDGTVVNRTPNLVLAERYGVEQNSVIQTPKAWGELKGIKILDFAGNWQWMYGYEEGFKIVYTRTDIIIAGVEYNQYTMNPGQETAASPVRFYFKP